MGGLGQPAPRECRAGRVEGGIFLWNLVPLGWGLGGLPRGSAELYALGMEVVRSSTVPALPVECGPLCLGVFGPARWECRAGRVGVEFPLHPVECGPLWWGAWGSPPRENVELVALRVESPPAPVESGPFGLGAWGPAPRECGAVRVGNGSGSELEDPRPPCGMWSLVFGCVWACPGGVSSWTRRGWNFPRTLWNAVPCGRGLGVACPVRMSSWSC